MLPIFINISSISEFLGFSSIVFPNSSAELLNKSFSSKLVTKAHSKSVHYYGSFHNNIHHLNIKKINRTNANYKE